MIILIQHILSAEISFNGKMVCYYYTVFQYHICHIEEMTAVATLV